MASWGDRFPGAHGMTRVVEQGTEYLWLTDFKTGEVVKTSLVGETMLQLQRPDLPAYRRVAASSPASPLRIVDRLCRSAR